jgi:hypothetical protein
MMTDSAAHGGGGLPPDFVARAGRLGWRAGWRLADAGQPTRNWFLGIARLAELSAAYDARAVLAIGMYRLACPRRQVLLDADPRMAELDRQARQAWLDDVIARATESARERARSNPWVPARVPGR